MKAVKFSFFLFSFYFTFTFLLAREKDTSKFYFKEVVISALRYPEKLLEVPLSVSFIDSKEFLGLRGLSLEEPLISVPGVLAQSRGGSYDVRITVRGFGSRGAGDRSNSGTVRGLKFLLDGIPQTEPDGRTSLDFFDISFVENIEIIRSNASALWGNAAGAVFSFSTVPTTNTPSISFTKSIGSWGLDKNVFQFKSNLGNKGVVFLNSLYNKFDGWRANSNSEKILFNFGIKTPLGSPTDYGEKEFYPTTLQVNINLAKNLFHIPGALTKATFDSLPQAANPIYLQNKERRNNRLAQVGVSLLHNFNENNSFFVQGFLTSKYLQRSERGTFRDFTRYFLGSTLYFQNQSNFWNLTNILLLGLDNSLQDGAILFYALDTNANRSTQLRTDKKEGASTFGMFVQDEILLGNLSLILGLRYDAVTYSSQDFLKFSRADEKKFDRLTPKVGLTYRLLDNFSLFGNIGGGIEVPAGNEIDPSPGEDTVFQINPLLEPIVSTTYELGFKSYYFFERFLKSTEFEASGFFIDTKNELIPYRDGRFYFSAGKTSRIGIEGFLKATFDYDVSFKASLTYMVGKFNDYKVDSSHYDKNKVGVFADFKNNYLPGVPKYFYYAALTIPFFANFEFSVNGISSYYCDDANKIEVPSFNIFNFRVWYDKIYINKKLNIRIAFSVNNVLDTKYVSSSFLNPIYEKGTNLPYFIEPGLPRNFLFSVGIKY